MAKQDDWVRLTVRLPQEVYSRLTAAVASGPNSMNAEIVTRLESSFAPISGSVRSEDNINPSTPENTLYILLDTNGMPISWQEAFTHLSEINKAGKLKFHSQNARILSSEHINSAERDEHDIALFLKYRKLNRKKLSKSALAFLEEFEKQEAEDNEAS